MSKNIMNNMEDYDPLYDPYDYKIVVDCDNEADQYELIQDLENEGRVCKPLIS